MKAKTVLVWVVLVGIFILVFRFCFPDDKTDAALQGANYNEESHFLKDTAKKTEINYTGFLELVEAGRVKSAVFIDDEIHAALTSGEQVYCIYPKDTDLIGLLKAKGVKIIVKRPEQQSSLSGTLINLLIWLLPLLFIILFLSRAMNRAAEEQKKIGQISSLPSRKKPIQTTVTFDDVAGISEAKEELQEIVEFLRNPGKFQKLGGRVPKGVLLMGPPGVGKTLLAKAVAGEAKSPFFHIGGSEFVEMFVGVGAARVRSFFQQARKYNSAIVFIDEIDAVGRHRGAGLGGGHDEREQTLNQLLAEMDGFDTTTGIVVIAATNRPDILDPALLRPGRFDRHIVVPLPDIKGREQILRVHSRRVAMSDDVDLSLIAKGTPGASGADLENIINEAALLAARNDKKCIGPDDIEIAKDKVLLGKERKSTVFNETEKRIISYHEAGHALAAKLCPLSDPVHKVTIIPRGMSLGLTQSLPNEDRHILSWEYLQAQLAVLLGGRAAEEIACGTKTTGAENDLERATEIARKMVCSWGMSEALGPAVFGKRREHIFLGKEIAEKSDVSEQTAAKIDEEIKKILDERYEHAKRILTERKTVLESLAELLRQKETVSGDEIDQLIIKTSLP